MTTRHEVQGYTQDSVAEVRREHGTDIVDEL